MPSACAPRSPVSPRAAAAPATPVLLDDDAVDTVIAWYDAHHRDLPWRRDTTSPWAVLVSEIMLQQTPVVRVLPRWTAWMQHWPRPADLAQAPTADVLRAWDTLGYPRRALRLQECARAITAEHDGEVPHTQEALRALPGIGEYTAAAVSAFAFAQRAVVVDTNVRRVLARAVRGSALPASSLTAAERSIAATQVPEDRARSVAWNQAVMELGALVCTARRPRCEECPLAAGDCRWVAAGSPAANPSVRRVQHFEGTDRQMRGQIMKLLRTQGRTENTDLMRLDPEDPDRVERCARSLVDDGLAVRRSGALELPS